MSSQTILLIDYDPVSISRTTTPLIKAGYQVEVAKDGLSGLAAFERMKPALVLVEAMLPRKHGFEVCQEIKAKPEGKSTPVLITTAVCRGRKYRMDALQIYGCDEYIEKPIADDELVSMIARLIEEAKQAREEIGQDLSDAIDTASVEVPIIESMDDAELEAKIDALLTCNDTPAESEEIPAPPVAQTEAAVETAAEAAESAVSEDPVLDAETETKRPLEATVQVDPAKIDQPAEPVLLEHDAEDTALPVQTPAIAGEPAVEAAADPHVVEIKPQSDSQPQPTPFADVATDAPAQPEEREWTETHSRGKKGGSKVVLFGVAAVASLGVVGFLAFQQGWIGGGAASEPAPTDGVDSASRLANHVPAPEGPIPALQPPAQDIVEQKPVEAATPVETPSKPVEAQPELSENVPPRPIVPPKPTFNRRSAADLQAARNRQAYADQELLAAAGSLQAQLLSEQAGDFAPAQDEPIQAVDVDVDDLIGTPVRPKARPKARYGELFEIDDVDRAPARVRFAQPVYDELARRLHQEGVVLVEVLIDESGQVAEARLVQEIPRSRLNEASLRAARLWSYFPAVKDGVPVKVWKTERIVFELE